MGEIGINGGSPSGLRAPEPLSSAHDVSTFRSGQDTLDSWLRSQALKSEKDGASRTYVVCCGDKICGYYCLAAGSVERARAPGRVRRNMPDPVPVMIIGRLAVHCDFQGYGLGLDLLRDALLRTQQAARIAGIRAILVHAISTKAMQFYQKKAGFYPSPTNQMTLMITLKDLEDKLFAYR